MTDITQADREFLADVYEFNEKQRAQLLTQMHDTKPNVGSKLDSIVAFRKQIGLAAIQSERERAKVLVEALRDCARQFAFYADEHLKADKHQKAVTNKTFENICNSALAAYGDGHDK